jgi:hypothetical protein
MRSRSKVLPYQTGFEYCNQCGKLRQPHTYCLDQCFDRVAKQLGFKPRGDAAASAPAPAADAASGSADSKDK